MNTKVDLRLAIEKLAIEDLNFLASIDIGNIDYDDNYDDVCKSVYTLNDIKNIPLNMLIQAKNDNYQLILTYKDKSFGNGVAYDYFDIGKVLSFTLAEYGECPVCHKDKYRLPITANDFAPKYKNVLWDGEYICADCQQDLHNEELGVCSSCGELDYDLKHSNDMCDSCLYG